MTKSILNGLYRGIMILIVLGCLNPVVLGANTDNKVKEQLEALNKRLEQNMVQSNTQLEKGNFHAAENYTTSVLNDLDILLEATMPLDERINQLIEKEESILHDTRKLPADSLVGAESFLEELIFNQVRNREKTNTASKLTSQQLDSASKSPDNSAGMEKNKREVLSEVKKLLDESSAYQTSAIDRLEENDYAIAEKKELGALDALKEALEKLRQGSDNQKGSQSQTADNQQNQSEQKQQQAQSQQSSQKQPSESRQEKQQAQAMQEQKKMNAEEALKELIRLRKQAREEQERRERELGIQATGQQYPVDKDW